MSTPTHESLKWIWLSLLATVVGYGCIFSAVFLNISTLFDYNGKTDGTEEYSLLVYAFLFAFIALGAVVQFLLLRAWKTREPGQFRKWHLIPIVLASTSIVLGLYALVVVAVEIID